MALGHPNSSYLKKAQLKQQSLYNDKQKSLELEIERLLKESVSHDITSIVQNGFVDVPSDLQAVLDQCKYDKISYDKAYNDMQQKVERLQAQLRDLKAKSRGFENTFEFIKNTSGTSVTPHVDKPKLSVVTPLSKKLHASMSSHSVPEPREFNVVKHRNVIAPRMFKINPSQTTRENVSSNTVTASSTGLVHTARTRRPQPKGKTRNARVPSASKSSEVKKNVTVEEHRRTLLLSKNQKTISSECNNIKLANCKQCLVTANHDACLLSFVNTLNSHANKLCANVPLSANQKRHRTQVWKPKQVVQICLWCVDSGCSKHMTRNTKLLINFVWKFLRTVHFGNDHNAAILGYGDLKWGNIPITRVYFIKGLGHNLFLVGQFCDVDLEVAFKRNTFFIKDLDDKLCANVPSSANQKRHKTQVWKPKQVGFKERLDPKPRLPRFSLKWLPSRRSFDLKGKLVSSKETNFPNNDKACTSNPQEPMKKWNIKLLINFGWKFLGTVYFGNDHIAAILGYGDLKRNTCLIRDLDRVDLLKGNRSTNLYTINLYDMVSASPICLMARGTPTKSWLWHQRLSHLNFDTINDLAKNDLDETPKVIKNFLKKIYVRLQALVIIVRTDNGTEFKNQVLKEYFDSVGITHETSAAKTPQQNGVVERRNRTSVEAARTMLIFCHSPLFLWAEAIATACYTQNHSIIHQRFNKTPYELIQGKKPDISYLYVFGDLCYPKNDREDISKLGAKGDFGFFIGYSANSVTYRVYNRRTRKIMKTMNVTFDELSAMAFEQNSSRPGLQRFWFGLTGFSDADYAGCKDTFKSTSAGAQFFGKKLVSWSSKKQDCTSLSITESEYVSLSTCCAQVLWMRTQLTDYGYHFDKILIYCDSKSAIAISCNPV
nr:Gag-Pol polyprotein [Tanacetum cinerariifolium]